MPLKPGKSKAVFSENISEFHKGKTFAATEKKFGKARANKQAIAVAYSEQRRSGKGQAMPTKAAMMKAEAKETPADEAKESPAYQRLERKMGVEKHPEAAAKTIGKGHSKKVGCGHAGCVGKGGCSVSLKKVGTGQGAVPDKMPKRKSRGAMPLPGAKTVKRRHKPPMNRGMPGGGAKGPLAAMGSPPPSLPPMGGGGPSGPPILPGAGVNGTPGMAPMGGGPAPMPRPPQRLPALPSTGGGWGATGMPPPTPGMGQARKSSAKKSPAKGKK